MVDTKKTADKLAARAATPATQGRTLAQTVELLKPQIQRALPSTMTAERFARIVLTELRKNPKLAECSQESFLGAVMLSAQLGLEPGPLGHCYYVPYARECQFILGYKGMIDLARRSGNITSIVAREVCERDEFHFEYGLDEQLVHRPALNDRGKAIAYYGVAKYVDGGHTILVMSREDIEKRRERSKAKNNGPWATDYDAMARKTVIRAMFPFLPVNVDASRAVAADEAVIPVDALDHDDLVEVIETTAVDTETGEITGPQEPPQQPPAEEQGDG